MPPPQISGAASFQENWRREKGVISKRGFASYRGMKQQGEQFVAWKELFILFNSGGGDCQRKERRKTASSIVLGEEMA